MVKYSIIIPTYDERENIGIIVSMIFSNLKEHDIDFEIVVVDDNSPDGTSLEVEKLIKIFGGKNLKLLKRPGKLGLGTAYIDGFSQTTGDLIFLMDADFSHHPKFLIDFINKQDSLDYDIVTGTRYIHPGGVNGWNVLRKLISRGANFFAGFLLRPVASDLTGSFRLYKRHVFEKLIKNVNNVGYAFQMEIIIRAQYSGITIGEVPITFVDRIYGYSKLGLKEVFIYFQTVIKLYSEL